MSLIHRVTTGIYCRIVDEIYVRTLRDIPAEKPCVFSVRPIDQEDLDSLVDAFGPRAQEFKSRMEQCIGWVGLSESNQPIGFLWGTSHPRPAEGEPPFLYPVTPRTGQFYLFDLFIAPFARRRGLARSLMWHAVIFAQLNNYQTCFAIHDQKNNAMIEVSKSLGFHNKGSLAFRRIGPWKKVDITALSQL